MNHSFFSRCSLFFLVAINLVPASLPAQETIADTLLPHLLSTRPGLFDSVLPRKKEWNIQIIYSQVDRNKKGKVHFTDHYFNVDNERYFYPASTVKLPVAILALQKLNELKVAGLDKYSTMITGADGDRQTEVCNDPSSGDGSPSIAHYIKKILLVSDNDAFNRLYEFLGQEYINNTLHRMGYIDAQIIHRLSISLTEEENRHTNPVMFMDSSGKTIYAKPPERSRLVYADRNTRLGVGYMKGEQLVKEPFDFSKKNRLPLPVLHNIVKSILFPDAVPRNQRFNLTNEDYQFLRKYMSMMPRESRFPAYDTAAFGDNYVKFIYYGAASGPANPGIRIFNKTGDAYGFMIDAAYVADFDHRTEFLVSATIYCNSDGIINDDKYDYNTVGLPFMKNLGRVLYQFELKRKRKYPPDLSSFVLKYNE